ncbi:hypothetical protein WMY93_025483 [Mugilogobius chulae]|uniref:Uncharacterized protein n=1 Tax=Mugilogobius chulae TaxID=88201 RepID=A0AAW0N4A0_9GOBI
MDFLRSKLDNSMSAFIKAKKELEEVLSAGGSNEQGHAFSEASAELKHELQRHRDLTSKLKQHFKENREPKKPRHVSGKTEASPCLSRPKQQLRSQQHFLFLPKVDRVALTLSPLEAT